MKNSDVVAGCIRGNDIKTRKNYDGHVYLI